MGVELPGRQEKCFALRLRQYGRIGQIPLDAAICQGGDSGEPIVVTDPDSPAGLQFRSIAKKILDRLRATQK